MQHTLRVARDAQGNNHAHIGMSRSHQVHLWLASIAAVLIVALWSYDAISPPEATAALRPASLFSIPGGYYDSDIRLELTLPDTDTTIVFTTDGSIPTIGNGSRYTRPIPLDADAPNVTVIRARAIYPDGSLGPVESESYFLSINAELPLLSLIVDPDDMWDQELGIYANPFERGELWERPADLTFVDTDRQNGFHTASGIRIHGHGTRGSPKKSFRIYFRNEYGNSRLEYPLYASGDVTTFKRLVLHNSGQDRPLFPHTNWTLLRNQLATELAAEIRGLAPASRPVLLFINGELWGIYQVRERLDRFFLSDHFGIDDADFLQAPDVAGEADVVMGSRDDWDRLIDSLETSDLSDPDSYAYVESQVDIQNFSDYYALQIYSANDDWPHQNVHQFRPAVQGGRWQWIFWDSDRAFSAAPTGRGDADILYDLLNYRDPFTEGRDTLLFRKLLENPGFQDRFLARLADLLNTTFSADSVIEHIDTLAGVIEPDVPYESDRWLTTANWAASVDELRTFARQRPDFVRQHMVEGLDTTGTIRITINPPADDCGTAAINGWIPDQLPWSGIFFKGVPISVTAVPNPGCSAIGWATSDLLQTPTIALAADASRELTPVFGPQDTAAPHVGDILFVDQYLPEDILAEDAWFTLKVTRPEGLDIRGWRVTDNDTKTANDEGSLYFADVPAFAQVPRNTRITIIVQRQDSGSLPADDLSTWDQEMILTVGNDNLNTVIDPNFNPGPNDSLAVLAPGATDALADDCGIALATNSRDVTAFSFGILSDGVRPVANGSAPTKSLPATVPSEGVWLTALLLATVVPIGIRQIIARTHSRASE